MSTDEEKGRLKKKEFLQPIIVQQHIQVKNVQCIQVGVSIQAGYNADNWNENTILLFQKTYLLCQTCSSLSSNFNSLCYNLQEKGSQVPVEFIMEELKKCIVLFLLILTATRVCELWHLSTPQCNSRDFACWLKKRKGKGVCQLHTIFERSIAWSVWSICFLPALMSS